MKTSHFQIFSHVKGKQECNYKEQSMNRCSVKDIRKNNDWSRMHLGHFLINYRKKRKKKKKL